MAAVITPRPAKLEDIPVLSPLMRAAIEALLSPVLPPHLVAASHEIMGLDRQLIADRTYYAAECGGRIVGCGGWSRRATLFGGDHTANLHVLGGPYQGAVTADLGLIPVAAIDHVEVLQDGAATQYGTDAIAGVVNIILKDKGAGGALEGTAGLYYKGDGETGSLSGNFGAPLGANGFINLTAEPVAWRVRDFADGWILCSTREAAEFQARGTNALIEPVYGQSGAVSGAANLPQKPTP